MTVINESKTSCPDMLGSTSKHYNSEVIFSTLNFTSLQTQRNYLNVTA